MLPTVVRGMDASALAKLSTELFFPKLAERLEAIGRGEDEPLREVPAAEVNERLSKLPQGPDEKLR
jgi:hypothetical protein